MAKKIEKIKHEAELCKQTFYDPTLDPVFKKIFDKKNYANQFSEHVFAVGKR